MSTIPASAFVSVLPSVLGAGGQALQLSGLLLTPNTRLPSGSVASFASLASVQSYFGLASAEAAFASIYFNGFNGSTALPGALLMSQYNQYAIQAYLRGGSVASLTLAQLQALSGSLSLTVSGNAVSASGITFTASTSFSNAASAITTALNYYDAISAATTTVAAGTATNCTTGTIVGNILTVAGVITGAFVVGGVLSGLGVTVGTTILSQITGTAGGAGTYYVSGVQQVGSTTITQTYALMTVASMTSGVFAVGQTLYAAGLNTGTTITAIVTGTGGAGTYVLSGGSQTMSAAVVKGGQLICSFDSISNAFVLTGGTPGVTGTITVCSGTLSTSLALTLASGAILSQGAAPLTPATAMPAIIAQTTNWATFTTLTDPDNGYGNLNKQAFAAWNNATGPDEFVYVAWDTDLTPTLSNTATASLGYILTQNGNNGTILVWGVDNTKAAFVMGMAASVNFSQYNGRTSFDFRSQPGLTPDVTSLQVFNNLKANGYNAYVSVATANQGFQYLSPGTITGGFQWADSYLNQIWLNSALQLALMNLLTNVKAIPYNTSGYTLVYSACLTPIQAAVNFGAINAGVTLSPTQIVEVNTAAGTPIDQVLVAQGWYLQILPVAAATRAARSSPPISLWYMDGGSINQISLSSIEIQ